LRDIQEHGAAPPAPRGGSDLADLLERILDKGIVIAGDVSISLLDVELLTIKLRLLVASVDKAREIGIDWWASDPYLSSDARELHQQNEELQQRVEELEKELRRLPQQADQDRVEQE
jgi:hypothetical protein